MLEVLFAFHNVCHVCELKSFRRKKRVPANIAVVVVHKYIPRVDLYQRILFSGFESLVTHSRQQSALVIVYAYDGLVLSSTRPEIHT